MVPGPEPLLRKAETGTLGSSWLESARPGDPAPPPSGDLTVDVAVVGTCIAGLSTALRRVTTPGPETRRSVPVPGPHHRPSEGPNWRQGLGQGLGVVEWRPARVGLLSLAVFRERSMWPGLGQGQCLHGHHR